MRWVIGQNVVFTLVLQTISGTTVEEFTLVAGVFFSLSLFAYMGGLAAIRQAQSRDELRKVNYELRATQALLAENTRIAERAGRAQDQEDPHAMEKLRREGYM